MTRLCLFEGITFYSSSLSSQSLITLPRTHSRCPSHAKLLTYTHTHTKHALCLSRDSSPPLHTHTPSLLTPRCICNAAGTLSSVLAEWGRLGRLCSAFGTLSIYWLNKQPTRKQQGPVSWLSFFWDVLIPRRPDARLHSASASCLKAAVFGFNLWCKKKKQSEVMQKSCRQRPIRSAGVVLKSIKQGIFHLDIMSRHSSPSVREASCYERRLKWKLKVLKNIMSCVLFTLADSCKCCLFLQPCFFVSFRWEEEYTMRMDLQQKITDLQEVNHQQRNGKKWNELRFWKMW